MINFSDIFQVNVLSGTRYELTGLEPTTIYDVVVATVNDDGSSLPELTLLLITEGMFFCY